MPGGVCDRVAIPRTAHGAPIHTNLELCQHPSIGGEGMQGETEDQVPGKPNIVCLAIGSTQYSLNHLIND